MRELTCSYLDLEPEQSIVIFRSVSYPYYWTAYVRLTTQHEYGYEVSLNWERSHEILDVFLRSSEYRRATVQSQ